MIREDRIEAPQWMATKFEKTPEGFLKGRAVITSTGIFDYLNADNTIRKELRLPEEVFSKDFLESVKLIPITMLHPNFAVDASNVKEVQIGTVGSNPSDPSIGTSDGYYLSVDMVITDADAIKKIEGGTRALSVGYSCDLEPAEPDARWCGQTYDFIQRRLRAQHLSVVPAGRQGDQAVIKLDAAGNAVINREENIKEDTLMADAIDVNVKVDASEVQNLIKAEKDRADGLQSNLDTLTTEKARIEAERDTHKDRADKAEAKVKELEVARVDEKAIEAAVARRVRILDAAAKAGVEAKDMKEPEIQKAVVLKVFPKANFDGKDQVYLDARFDGAVEQLAEIDVADAATRAPNAPVVVITDEAPADSRKARDAYRERLNKKDKV